MTIIIGFDPGVTTGVALVNTQTDKYGFYQIGDSLRGVYDFLDDYNPNEVVFEMFKHRPGQGHAVTYSLQVIGVIRLWCEQNKVLPESYVPSETKKFWTDEKIRALGLWKGGGTFVPPTPGSNHAMDALRCLLRYQMDYYPSWSKATLSKFK